MLFDYYAYWNGSQIRDLFEALVAVCSGPSYRGLLKSAILAGFLVSITGALLRWQGLGAKIYLFAALLFYSVMLIPRCEINIHDERSADVYVVGNVPLGVGFFASVSSKIGHFLTQSFEAAFSLPDAERFSRFGLVYPQRAVSSLLAAGPVTPEGRALTERITADCIGPELMDHPEKMTELAHTGSLWTTITQPGWVNPARSTLSLSGEVQSCDVALEALDNHLNDVELDFIKKRLGALLVPERADPSEVIARTLPHSEALLLGVSRSLEESLKHSVMLTALPHGLASIARQAGAPLDLAVKFSASSANLSSEINYRTLAKLAENALPKIRNCVEFIVIAAFPLMLVLMVAAGASAGVVFRSFFVLIIWFQLWAPLFSVANYLMITVDANPMNRVIAEFGGSTLLAADLIRETGASSQAIAGSLMLLIPVIAFALAKGSDMAFVSMASGLMAPAQSASGSVSAQIASGNASAGNVSLGNSNLNSTSANKSDMSASWSDPYASRTQTAYGSVTRDGDGIVTGMQKTAIDLGVSSSASLTQSRSAVQSSSSGVTLTSSESAALSISNAAASGDAASRSFAVQLSESLSNRLGQSHHESETQSSGLTQNVGMTSAGSRAVSNSEGLALTSGAQFKAAVGAASAESLGPNAQTPNAQTPNGTVQSAPAAEPASPAPVGPSGAVPMAFAAAPNPSAAIVSSNAKVPASKPNAPQNADPSASGIMSSLRGAAEGISAGIGGEVKTGQQMIDTATNSNTAATLKQRAEAYQKLRSASEEIAHSASDDQVRARAQTFITALDKAYRSTIDRGQTTAQTQSASSAVSEGLSGSDVTGVNRDAHVMNRYISANGASPEQALRDLFHDPHARDMLGAQVSADALDRAADAQYLGTGQIQTRPLQTRTLKNRGFETIREQREEDKFIVASKGQTFRQENEQNHPVQSDIEVRKREFLASFDQRSQSNTIERETLGHEVREETQTVQENLENYRRDQYGMSTLLKNAYAGGIGYQPPTLDEKQRKTDPVD